MNFNIYLDDETGQQLTLAAQGSGEAVLGFQGIPDMPPFEASRDQLTPPSADPLA